MKHKRKQELVEVSQNFTLEHLLSACNLIAFFSSYSVSPNSISTLLLQLHSQNFSLLQNQNQNPLSSNFCVCFPSTPQFHQRKIRFFLYLVDSIFKLFSCRRFSFWVLNKGVCAVLFVAGGFVQGILAFLWILKPLSR